MIQLKSPTQLLMPHSRKSFPFFLFFSVLFAHLYLLPNVLIFQRWPRKNIFCVPPAGCFSRSYYVHLMCSVYRPLPCGHQRPDVLRNDRKLFFHNRQTCRYMGGCSPVGTARSGAPPAEQGGPGLQRARPRGTLHHQDLPGSPRHHLCSSAHLRQRQTLVVLRLLLLFAHTFHHHLLFSDCKENPQSRESLYPGE